MILVLCLATPCCSPSQVEDQEVSFPNAVVVETPPRLPKPEQIFGFVADPIPDYPDYYADFHIGQAEIENMLRNYKEVDSERFRYVHHVIGGERTGHFMTITGGKVHWMAKPGGLATLEFSGGDKIYLLHDGK